MSESDYKGIQYRCVNCGIPVYYHATWCVRPIRAIEREARRQALAEVRAAIGALSWDGHFASCGGVGCLGERRADWDAVHAAIDKLEASE